MADDHPRTETERLNFPVPRELRDHIYEYLFDAEDNIYQSKPHDTPTIRLDTAVFGVNKTISSEAKDAFAKQNTFVQFNVNPVRFDTILRAARVRVVQGYTGGIYPPRNWCGVGMEVTIDVHDYYRVDRDNGGFKVLVRSQDLDAIAQGLQWRVSYVGMPKLRHAIKAKPGGIRTYVFLGRPNMGPRYDITFCLKGVYPRTKEAMLLEPFMNCIGVGHLVKVTGGHPGSTLPARLIRRLTPRYIDLTARAWTVLQSVQTWCRSLLDAHSFVDDTPKRASTDIHKDMVSSWFIQERQLLRSISEQLPELAGPTTRAAILLEDAQLSSAAAFMRIGGYTDLVEAETLLISARDFETFIQNSPSMRDLGFLPDSTIEGQETLCHPFRIHLRGLLHVFNLLCKDTDAGQDARDVLTHTLEVMAAEKDKHPKLSYIARDYEALTELASDPVQANRLYSGEMESSELLGKLSINDTGIMEEAKIAAAWDFTIPDWVDGWERRVD